MNKKTCECPMCLTNYWVTNVAKYKLITTTNTAVPLGYYSAQHLHNTLNMCGFSWAVSFIGRQQIQSCEVNGHNYTVEVIEGA